MGTRAVSRGPGRPANPIQRTELVRLALESFARAGYAGTSMESIAKRAGLSKASLFHHFSSKDELYEAALATIVDDLDDLVRNATWASTSYARALDRLGEMIVDYLGAHPLAAQLLTRELLDGGSYMQGRGAHAVQAGLEATAAFLSAGMRIRAFRRQDPKQLALSIVGLHIFYFAMHTISSRFIGGDVFAPRMIAVRKVALLEHVRALCLAQPRRRRPVSSKKKVSRVAEISGCAASRAQRGPYLASRAARPVCT